MIKHVWQHTNPDYREEAREQLAGWYPVGATVAGVYMHGNKNGDGHTVKFLAVGRDGSVINSSYAIARLLGRRYDDGRGGVYVRGGNTDPVTDVVYSLSRELHGDGYQLIPQRV